MKHRHDTVMTGKRTPGFTLVELLIVIVIIAILATITVIAYNGIQNRAYDSATMSELHNLGQQAGLADVDQSGFTSDNPLKVNPSAYNLDDHNNGAYCAAGDDYGISILSKSGHVFYVYDGQGVKQADFTWTESLDTTCALLFSGETDVDGGWMYWGEHWSDWVKY